MRSVREQVLTDYIELLIAQLRRIEFFVPDDTERRKIQAFIEMYERDTSLGNSGPATEFRAANEV